jgi:Asp-tRNA(Asn)/Glu-tRNA(Gln) amidotransferase A subunit family amidase
MNLCELTAAQLVELLDAGQVSATDVVDACLQRISELDSTLLAWVHLDPEHAREQARRADHARQAGRPTGPLHGIPVGIKDIFDTHDMPTEDGTVLHAGRTPATDATVVARLREAGAIVLGKTATTELAVFAPAKTTNPHDAQRTPGGSSSGSAAAVAAHMVPLALGTQTAGSVIRPASYCGVCGFKPSHGLISRHGVLQQSRTLDQVGVFGRSVADVALLADVLVGFDERDPDTGPRARPQLYATASQAPPLPPHIGFCKSPQWDLVAADARAAFAELREHLGDDVDELELPSSFDDALDSHRTVMEADIAGSFGREFDTGKEHLSPLLGEMVERGRSIRAVDYNEALEHRVLLNLLLDEIFHDYDAILTPATTGEAPLGLDSTGNPALCSIWTLCGVPTVTLPLLQGEYEMPIGVQLVGSRLNDARLLRTAHWLASRVEEDGEEQV